MRLLRLIGSALVLIVWTTSGRSQTLTQDSLALVDLYNSTNGPAWTTNTNWLSGPISTWFGVTVAGNRVAILSLNNNNLVGTLPSSVTNLTALTSLQFSGNQLSGAIPSTIGNLVNLTVLRLDDNLLTGPVPPSIGSMSILVELTLFDNLLTDSIPTTFANLTDLQTLTIQNNEFDALPNLSALGALDVLNVANNRLTFEDLEPNIGVPNTSFIFSPQDSVGSYEIRPLAEGGPTTLTVTVGGSSNTYQWLKNGNPISGATSSSYTITTVTASDSGLYSCLISNTVATGLTLQSRTIRLVVSGSAPSAPTNLVATGVSNSQANLSWTAPGGVINRYRIFRSFSQSTGYSQIDSVAVPTTTYSNTALTAGTTYFYRVFAVGNFGMSAASNTDSATTFGNAPFVVSALRDTVFHEGYVRRHIRILRNVFSDTDSPVLTFSTQSNAAEVLSVISSVDSLYVQEVQGFVGTSPVVVSASDGVSTVADTFVVTVIADTVRPTLSSLQFPTSQTGGSAVDVSCTVTDNFTVSSVALNYRVGNGAFTSLSMTAAGNTYSASIPGADVTASGLSFYVLATDNRNNVRSSDTTVVQISFAAISSRSVAGSEYATGVPDNRWRLISVPGVLTNTSIAAMFPGSGSGDLLAYGYLADNLAQTTTVPTGRAVWFRHQMGTDTAAIHGGAGLTASASSATILLTPRWNLIGNPYPFPITISLPQDTIYGPIRYTGTATEVAGWSGVETTLRPFGGYAVYNRGSQNRQLVIRPSGVQLSKSSNSSDKGEIVLRIGARGQKESILYGDLFNYFTVLDHPRPGDFNAPEPNGPGESVSVYFRQGSERLTSLCVQPSDENGYVFDVYVQSTMDHGAVELEFEVAKILPGYVVRVLNISEPQRIDLGQPIHLLHTRQPVQLRVLVGEEEFVERIEGEVWSAVPERFELAQNYPNPFNPTTQLPFSLSRQSKVTLKVYNTLGQEVRTLLAGRILGTGYQAIMWDGRDNMGREIATGMYLYRIQLETIDGHRITQTRKMMYVK